MTKKNKYPLVSLCTPTFNRRPFIPIMFECFRNQNYPKDKIEWIIVDDGTDKIKDLIDDAKIPQIKYFPIDTKMLLGAKRNFMHSKTSGSIIVYMDDDDYYPPDRISHAVEKLQGSTEALCAGASELYVYFKHIQKMYQCGPYGPNHATAGTFAFKRKLLDITKYNETAALAEEREFLKDYTIPFIQLDPMKTILVFSHEHNSFDKRKLLDNPHPMFMKESDKKVEDFIKFDYEKKIKKFFMEKIDNMLLNYKPGDPSMKPDVLEQLKVIEENRQKMIEEHNKANAGGQIMMHEPGKPPVALSVEDIVNIVNSQKQQLDTLAKQNQEYQGIIHQLQTSIVSLKLNGSQQQQQTQNINYSGNPEQVNELKKQKYELQEKVQELQTKIISLKLGYENKEDNRELEELRRKNAELESENKMLKEKVKQASPKKSVSFEDNIRKGFLNDSKKENKSKSSNDTNANNNKKEETPVVVKERLKSDPEVVVII